MCHPVRWTTAQWCGYYRRNAKALLPIPWEQGAELSPAERAAIAASLQDFQLGESSEGQNLVRAARAYAAQAGDEHYEEAVRLFIAEEQRHARDLGRFLTLAGIPLLNHTWRDAIFRWLRRLAGLELFLTVLVTAEMIGRIYYKALRKATGSLVLRRLCDQLLRDEIKHIRFHVERLALLRRNRPRWKVLLAQSWHGILFGGTSLMVWHGHRRALRAGGYGFGRFWRECWQVLNASLRPIDPRDLFVSPSVEKQMVPAA
jgi:hypothetical protein